MTMMELDLVNTPMDEVKEKVDQFADQLYDNIINNAELPTMKESIYRQYFLPRIIGKVIDGPNEVSWINRWISAVGSVSTNVNIISDSSTKDNIEYLYEAPAVIPTMLLGVRSRVNTMNDVVSDFLMRSNNMVMGTNDWMRNRLDETKEDVLNDIDEEKMKAHVRHLRNIINHYGLMDEEQEVEEESVIKETKQTTIVDDDDGGLGDMIQY